MPPVIVVNLMIIVMKNPVYVPMLYVAGSGGSLGQWHGTSLKLYIISLGRYYIPFGNAVLPAVIPLFFLFVYLLPH